MEPDGLFPVLPEDLSSLSDEELSALLTEHETAVGLINADDDKFTAGLEPAEVISQFEAGVEQIKALRAEQKVREEEVAAFEARKAELAAEAIPAVEIEALADESGDPDPVEGDEGDGTDTGDEAAGVLAAEEEPVVVEEEPVVAAVTASNATVQTTVNTSPRSFRRAPAPSVARGPVDDTPVGTQLVAAAGTVGLRPGVVLNKLSLAQAMIDATKRLGKPSKRQGGSEERILIASADFPFPEDRTLYPSDADGNTRKIREVGNPFLGREAQMALVASGGLCAPLTPFYDIPDFAVTDRPVRDALPSFRAERGGVSVPSVSTIGSITSAITVIEEDNDALGGTFATKSCQSETCASWSDVAVGIISHCREYGNLNAMAWPEGIAHENNLTMAAHARTAETRLLNRIKSLSVNVTTTDVYSATHDLIYAIERAAAGIRYRLRLGEGAPALRALLPAWVPGMLVSDVAATQFDRFKSQADMRAILRDAGVMADFYLDDVTGGTSQGYADQAAGALQDFPKVIQWAVFVEGEFLHIDSGVLELGIVRDSTLNSTNDYQVFGETFENVARIGPTQGALWVSSTVCPSGEFPALTTALSC